MLDAIDWETLQEWRAFDAYICPLGPDKWDAAMGAFMAIVARYLGGIAGEEKHVISDISPKSFCPWLKDEDDEEIPVDNFAAAQADRANMEFAILQSQAHLRS